VTNKTILPPRTHSWSPKHNLAYFPEHNQAHAGEIRTNLAHGGIGAHLATSPLGARHRAPSGDVCSYPNSRNIGRTECRWGEGPWASARILFMVIATPRKHDEISVNFFELLFVFLVYLLKARPLHRHADNSNFEPEDTRTLVFMSEKL